MAEKTIFFAPEILASSELPQEEAQHCLKVLRKKAGDEILIADGKGTFYDAVLVSENVKSCVVDIVETIAFLKYWNYRIHIAFAPTKNLDRIEWFVEKAVEFGIDRITPLLCRFSDRKEIKIGRLEKIAVAAMKQSQKALLPVIDELTPFKEFVKEKVDGQKFIAHCHPGEKSLLKDCYVKGSNVLILIGPEGDFSDEEVALALANGFTPISLGESRLRTETAALSACHTIHVLN